MHAHCLLTDCCCCCAFACTLRPHACSLCYDDRFVLCTTASSISLSFHIEAGPQYIQQLKHHLSTASQTASCSTLRCCCAGALRASYKIYIKPTASAHARETSAMFVRYCYTPRNWRKQSINYWSVLLCMKHSPAYCHKLLMYVQAGGAAHSSTLFRKAHVFVCVCALIRALCEVRECALCCVS
jgi:hypothetical protein